VQTISRIVTRLMTGVLIVGVSFMIWMARGSRAQDAKPAPTPPEHSRKSAPDPAIDSSLPLIQDTKPSAPPAPEPSHAAPDSPKPLPNAETQLPGDRPSVDPPLQPVEKSTVPAPEAPSALPATTDDPEKAAEAFVQENQKLADAQLKALKDEAEKLRARLRKVEAGIKRWESLKNALQKSQELASTSDLFPSRSFAPVQVSADEHGGIKKPAKKPHKIPSNDLERRGFTGQ
jgi:hypothetical protein